MGGHVQAVQQRIDQPRDQRLGDCSQAQARQRDAELAAREVEIQAFLDVPG